jgi:hypothetical protein
VKNFPANDQTAAYIREFIPLVGEQTSIERAWAECSYVQGLIGMASAGMLIDIDTWKLLREELQNIYQKQVDRFETKI